MNILFIIGNGFDLNLGLKTSYSHFYEHYKSINTQSSSINKLKKVIDKDLKNWSDLELAFGEYTDEIESVEEFNVVFEDIGDKLADYLEKEEHNFDFSKIDKESFFEYLSFPEHSLLPADKNKLSKFREKWNTSPWNVNIITFNYTKSIEKLIGNPQSKVRIGTHDSRPIVLQGIEHIHGYMNERMVLGVNDVSQIANTSFHNNQEVLVALVKEKCNQAQKHTIDELCQKQISTANLICIFGSSIGDTDNMWWDIIGNQLKRDCHIIIFDKNDKISRRRGYKIAPVEQKRKDFFLSKTNLTEEEKKKASNNIFCALNTDMFKEIASTAKEEEVTA
nr:bacteriophage abortive infection AbiH family protein [uncultured Marinifilum sp.]